MATKIALNGFGRIGRYLVRLLADSSDIEVVAVNARSDNASLAHLFKYDSIHGTFKGEVSHNDVGIVVNGKTIRITRDNLNEYSWADLDI
ncbi:MAG: type I glyceraldehyde-3-phosphate dehydrogenase, partial [Desulfovibrio sp.]|nr:type I glyceraldehyde-3-phosphate dehydrogenase [Desulfovibrio sp.]